MLKIGITGNIGSGKTTVSRLFEILGIPVFYSDTEAKKVMVTDAQLISAIKKHFGEEAYFADGSLNRKLIAGVVFNNEAELRQLNTLVHPAVFRAFDQWVLRYPTAPYVLKEAAVLFESGSYKDCNYTIIVTAPTDMRMARVMQRDGISEAEAQSREAKQMPQEQKQQLASYIINNDNTKLVIPQALAIHRELIAQAGLTPQ
jgi:dephospho-CoA kinase